MTATLKVSSIEAYAEDRLRVVAARAVPTDGDLVRRSVAGDRRAEEQLFRRHAPSLVRFVTRLVARSHDADDVVQDTFAEALRDLGKLREPDAFRSWLYRIAVNRSKKTWRKRKLLSALGLDRGQDDATLARLASPGLDAEAHADLDRVDHVLSRLPAEERAAWILHRVEGETCEAIAEIAGHSLATAKRRIAAAQSAIDAHLDGRKR